MREAWLQTRSLISLHPNYPMLADLNARIATLRAQQQALAAGPLLDVPPETAKLHMEALAALPGPKPAVESEQLQAEFLAQLLVAKRRSLQRRFELERDKFHQSLLDIEVEDRLRLWREAEIEAADAMRSVEDKYQQAITAAFLTQEATYNVYQRQRARGSKVDERYIDYLGARKRYEALLRKQQAEHASIQLALAQTKQNIERNGRQTTQIILQQQIRWLEGVREQEYKRQEEQLKAQLAMETRRFVVPDMAFYAELPDTMTMPLPGLHDEMITGNVIAQEQAAIGRAEINGAVLVLLEETRQLHADIERDIREVASALADRHGYRVHFTRQAGADLTRPMQQWMTEYWATTP